LFWLIKDFHYSGFAYGFFTFLVVGLTVGGLAYALYKIDKRPLVFGTLVLALASVLLLVPSQPYAGGLLPVNMAMLATRNLEYVFYIAGLVLMIKSPSLRHPRFWAGGALLALVVASDKLFLSLSVGGALLALVAYALQKGWKPVSFSVRWLIGGAAAGLVAVVGLGLIGSLKLTHIAGQGSTGPYALVHSAHDAALGLIYGLLGFLTNFGANPAFDATRLHDLAHNLEPRLLGLTGPGFIVNTLILLTGLYVAAKVLLASVGFGKAARKSQDVAGQLSLALLWSSIAAFGVFVVTNHYYAADARYLTIAVFALFITLATYARTRTWKAERLVLVGILVVIGIIAGTGSATLTYRDQKAALSDVNQRNKLIPQVLKHHQVQTLVGDYWRVVPVKFESGSKQQIMPLGNCTVGRQALSSSAWQYDLRHHSFAYLLSLDGSLTDFPHCSLNQVISQYGRPNASTVIAGSLTDPKELLLFYDQGSHRSSPSRGPLPQQSATVQPIAPDELPFTSCAVPTIMNIVAHQDDDLLFMNPDLLHDMQAGHCIRTIYITAGDAGHDSFYWLSRERGSEAAYSGMLGLKNQIWIERIVKLGDHQFATVANIRGNNRVSLIFVHLPDGNLRGEGFGASHYESLEKLEAGKIQVMHSVDGQSNYSLNQLADSLTILMHIYQPAEIRTQSNFAGGMFADHSDHMAVGRLAKKSYASYENQQYENRITVPLKFYVGYPVHAMDSNISDGDLQAKEEVFLNYARFDGGVCASAQMCAQTATYNSYLSRQYQSPY
jgi:LmbE family N-acetylglucosaminyl deacetylase